MQQRIGGRRRIARHRYATFAVAREGEAYHRRPGGPPRRGRDPAPAGKTGVAGTRSWRDVSCGTRSDPCRVLEEDSARRGGAEWLAGQMSRETRRGRRMRRQGNTRRRAIPHHGAGSGYPDGCRVAQQHSPPPLPAAIGGRGARLLHPEADRAKAPRPPFATVRCSILPTTFALHQDLFQLRRRAGGDGSCATRRDRPTSLRDRVRPRAGRRSRGTRL